MTQWQGKGPKPVSARMPILPFHPTVHYRRAGDQFIFYWDEADDFPEQVPERNYLALLRAHSDHDLITGVRINSLSRVMLVPGANPPDDRQADRSHDEQPDLFRPYAFHDAGLDDLIIRWAARTSMPDEKIGKPHFTLLRNDDRIIIGVILHEATKALHLSS